MTLFILKECKKHKEKEQMVVFFDKEQNAYGCLPACKSCLIEDVNYLVYDSWEEALHDRSAF